GRPWWWLFPPDAVHPSTDDFQTERAYHLSLSLAQEGNAPVVVKQGATWLALQSGWRAAARRPWTAENRRWLGTALNLAVMQFGSPTTLSDPWPDAAGPFLAGSIVAFKQAVAVDPGDFTANLYVAEHCKQAPFLDVALEHLRRLQNQTANNPAKMTVQAGIAAQVAELEARIAAAREKVAPTDLTFRGLERYAEAGLLAEALDRVDAAELPKFPGNQIDRLGTWFLLLGRPADAVRIYEAAAESTAAPTLPAAVRLTRLAVAHQAQFHPAEARRFYLKALDGAPQHLPALWGMNVLNLWAGDREQTAAYLAKADAAGPSPAWRDALDRIRPLLEVAPPTP
ncbi:MAG: tetratricopeptide repeat protein, partial [Planctomycetia bacterium]